MKSHPLTVARAGEAPSGVALIADNTLFGEPDRAKGQGVNPRVTKLFDSACKVLGFIGWQPGQQIVHSIINP